MRSFLGLPNDSRQRDSSVVNTLVDGKSCVSSSRIGSDRCAELSRFHRTLLPVAFLLPCGSF
jgi:hypothetical protein